MEKWEYTYRKTTKGFNADRLIDDLNFEGEDGWELVQLLTDKFGVLTAIMKRKVIK